MGEAQRIFYYHVPSAWLSFVAFGVTLIAGIAYLRTSDHRWDRLGIASVEVGIVFAVMALLSGMLWARPIWNTWWTWGSATHDVYDFAVDLLCLSHAASRNRRPRQAGAIRIGLRHRRLHQRADHLLLHLSVAHDPSGGIWQKRVGDQDEYGTSNASNLHLLQHFLYGSFCYSPLASLPS